MVDANLWSVTYPYLSTVPYRLLRTVSALVRETGLIGLNASGSLAMTLTCIDEPAWQLGSLAAWLAVRNGNGITLELHWNYTGFTPDLPYAAFSSLLSCMIQQQRRCMSIIYSSFFYQYSFG